MQVQVQTDDHIQGGESLIQWAQQEATTKLARFRDYLTRVEIFFSDTNAGKGGANDKRCVIEARPANHQPLSAQADASKVADAFAAALEKIMRVVGDDQERHRAKQGHETIRTPDGRVPGR
ncbi:HPF/RaiA family ribosome-associated protein [Melaminivora alkalimesophila]|uniref:Sigma 54 modulation/S30EA-like ribosomal protein n=1 Tax=Melaminivora alkalimesophila TaxID=1165852 RepID=A0A317RD36_9BURK|nr:HPF/RaiA family ribosome-associated protein [Melaminivora alkalimesophila]PWW47003.1 sigma 54 modulation/S30EA-like ribosomal protein [Melaminivora alkalimesophila]